MVRGKLSDRSSFSGLLIAFTASLLMLSSCTEEPSAPNLTFEEALMGTWQVDTSYRLFSYLIAPRSPGGSTVSLAAIPTDSRLTFNADATFYLRVEARVTSLNMMCSATRSGNYSVIRSMYYPPRGWGHDWWEGTMKFFPVGDSTWTLRFTLDPSRYSSVVPHMLQLTDSLSRWFHVSVTDTSTFVLGKWAKPR